MGPLHVGASQLAAVEVSLTRYPVVIDLCAAADLLDLDVPQAAVVLGLEEACLAPTARRIRFMKHELVEWLGRGRGGDDAGVREPRRPLPRSGADGIAIELC